MIREQYYILTSLGLVLIHIGQDLIRAAFGMEEGIIAALAHYSV
jgi:hypothetical protein